MDRLIGQTAEAPCRMSWRHIMPVHSGKATPMLSSQFSSRRVQGLPRIQDESGPQVSSLSWVSSIEAIVSINNNLKNMSGKSEDPATIMEKYLSAHVR